MAGDAHAGTGSGLQGAVLLGGAVFAAAMLGILTRPLDLLATLWPANAVMLGLLLRVPRLASKAGWLAALLAYLAADLSTGAVPLTALLLSAANLVSVGAGYLLLSRLPAEDLGLQRPTSTLYLAGSIAVAAAASGCVGGMIDPVLFGGSFVRGWSLWFASEMVSHMAILPMLLTLPAPRQFKMRGWLQQPPGLLWRSLPVQALPLSCVLGIWVGGPGALSFPVPALLWCALSYGLSGTTMLTFLFGSWTLLAVSRGYLPNSMVDMNSMPMQLSLRLGVTLVTLGPIMVASVMCSRQQVLERLQLLADHDALTGLLNRRAFCERAQSRLDWLRARGEAVALLMLDLDRFKSINDSHGHAAGDQVLKAFAGIASEGLHQRDVIGRLGGEEFAVLLPACDGEVARQIAEGIRARFESTPIHIGQGRWLQASVCLGVASSERAQASLESLLLAGDKALYRAKHNGRNRVEAGEPVV